MLTDSQNLELVYKGFKAVFAKGFGGAPSYYQKIAMTVPSSASSETYSWLGTFPGLHKWIGDRIIHKLGDHGFTIKNEKFESTIEVERDDISDDRIGIFKPMFEEMGRISKQHPDELIFSLLGRGFAENCYDGQFFFDTDHRTVNKDGVAVSASNTQAGAGPAWFLLDTTRAIKPLLWQEREPYKFESITNDNDSMVFFRDKYVYGIRARASAGFGLWQLAFGSKAALDLTNYKAARQAMMSLRQDNGRALGITPNILIVPPELEESGRNILKAAQLEGSSNIWQDTADLLVSPYLA